MAQFFKGISAAYTSLAITIGIMVALFLLVLQEVALSKEHAPPLQARDALAMLKPLASRDFALVWVSRCLMYLGYTTIVNFMFFFLQDAVHYTGVFPGQTTAQGCEYVVWGQCCNNHYCLPGWGHHLGQVVAPQIICDSGEHNRTPLAEPN